MGHGNSNKLYITHAEHAGDLGQHSASSSGYKTKQQVPHPRAQTPFDCCALSFQPFEHPVCARNGDGTGFVFDLVNIIPWLKQHNNTNPITKEPLLPNDLIKLNYSRKPSGEIHDPISFKPFNEHSHIVAIATTGNVFLAESIRGGNDLLEDKTFKSDDVITLQNPHGLPTESPLTGAAAVAMAAKNEEKAKISVPKAVSEAKKAVPWNISPYSSGAPGASLTSTSVDPQTQSSKLLWDEEELMFEEISNPPKGKGKEKDVGKRRAYVRVITSLGGSLNLELYCEKAPKTCYNFLMLARAGKYDNCLFHRLIPGFMAQTGDPIGTGAGGQSHWGTPFRDEYDLKGAVKHDSRGIIAMANKGAGTNGSQWYVTFRATPHLDNKHTVFGKLVGGEEVLDTLEKLPRKEGTERPAKPVRITEVVIHQDPFETYKTRLAKKLARRAEAISEEPKISQKLPGDNINWFGVKVGRGDGSSGSTPGAGVGKYLGSKRPLELEGVNKDLPIEESKKRKRLGFATYPLKLLSPKLAQDIVAIVYVLSYGGGLVNGDHVKLNVDAVTILTSSIHEGSTKVFKTRPGDRPSTRLGPAAHTVPNVTTYVTEATVAPGSALFLLPDPVTCFRAASYSQTQRITLSSDASLVLLDWVTSGRRALGEEWVFSRYHSLNEVFLDGHCIARDITLLEDLPHVEIPDTSQCQGLSRTLQERLKPYSCYATLILVGPLVQRVIAHLNKVYQSTTVFKIASPARMIWAMSPISEGKGYILRAAGVETEDVKDWLRESLRGFEDVVGVDTYLKLFV
ncbi:hypothetical protein J3R82DRAFT_687 [Butyriboletus roseoflavus]|nr:hypothetical protein J3R82DRAFT_687 [Butyriboletus roseoflavus]